MTSRGAYFVAAIGSDSPGVYGLAKQNDAFELEHFWIKPVHMRVGTGKALFQHAVRTAQRLGAIKIASDPNAVTFYEKMGTVRVGEKP